MIAFLYILSFIIVSILDITTVIEVFVAITNEIIIFAFYSFLATILFCIISIIYDIVSKKKSRNSLEIVAKAIAKITSICTTLVLVSFIILVVYILISFVK